MDDQDPSSAQEQPQRGLITQYTFESAVDQRFAQALADGLFDNLPGMGKPQRLDDDSLVPEDERTGFRLLKSNGFAPFWIEARKDIEQAGLELEQWFNHAHYRWPRLNQHDQAMLRSEYRRKLEDLQRMILTYNLRLPPGIDHLANLRVEDEMRKLGES